MLKSVDDSRFADHKRGQTKCYQNGNNDVEATLITSLQVMVVLHLLQMQLCILALRLPSLLRFLLRIISFLEKKHDFIYFIMTSSIVFAKKCCKNVSRLLSYRLVSFICDFMPKYTEKLR